MKKALIFNFLLLCKISFAQVNLNTNLSGCYQLDGSAAEPINNLTGTVTGVTATTDRFNMPNSAMQFSGTPQSFIVLPNSPLLKPTALTITGWFNPQQVNNTSTIIFAKNIFTSWFTAYALNIENIGSGTKFYAAMQNGSTSHFVGSTTTPVANTWYHVVMSIDNTAMKIYVNGVLENSAVPNITNFNYDASRNVIIGGTNELNYNAPYSGKIDNLRFYNRILTASEVSALYTQDPQCIPLPPPPVAFFGVSSPKICAGQTIAFSDFSTNTPTAWNWQVTGAAAMTSTLNNPVLIFPASGNYTASLISSNSGGASNSATMSIVVVPNPTLQISSSKNPVCNGSQASLFVSGASSYTWSNQLNTAVLPVSPAATTIYSVTGVDNNGCTATAFFTQSVVAVPVLTVSAVKNNICRGVTTTLSATGASNYTWNTSQTTSSFTLTPQNSFTYVVTGMDNNGCANTASIAISVQACLGISEGNLNNGITLYPNPANSFVNLSANSLLRELTVTDLTGKILFTSELNGFNYSFNINEYAAGIYFVKVKTDDGVKTLKFLKQ